MTRLWSEEQKVFLFQQKLMSGDLLETAARQSSSSGLDVATQLSFMGQKV